MSEEQDAIGNPKRAESSGSRRPTEANFLQFLSGMAAQALMHLGLMTNPLTGKAEQDLVNAKYSIDLLGVLQEKTQGNRTEEEEEYLSAALYELRMRYLQATEHREESAPTEASDADEKVDG